MKLEVNMKKFVAVLLLVSTASWVSAQDCTLYFPSKVGETVEVTHYNQKGKEQSKSTTKVIRVDENGGDITIDAELSTQVKKDTHVIEYSASCIDGVFKLNMFGGITSNEMAGNFELDGDFLDIPSNPQAGDMLDNKTIIMRLKAGEDNLGLVNLKYHFTNRKIEALEKITTPAGTFDAIKMSYDMEFKMGLVFRMSAVEWYVKGVGMVRSELYRKGKLDGYSEITALN